jgi:hypothetical protein
MCEYGTGEGGRGGGGGRSVRENRAPIAALGCAEGRRCGRGSTRGQRCIPQRKAIPSGQRLLRPGREQRSWHSAT